MTPLEYMSMVVDRLADGFMRRELLAQDAEIERVLEEAHVSGAIKGEVCVVMTYRAGQFPRLQARLA